MNFFCLLLFWESFICSNFGTTGLIQGVGWGGGGGNVISKMYLSKWACQPTYRKPTMLHVHVIEKIVFCSPLALHFGSFTTWKIPNLGLILVCNMKLLGSIVQKKVQDPQTPLSATYPWLVTSFWRLILLDHHIMVYSSEN